MLSAGVMRYFSPGSPEASTNCTVSPANGLLRLLRQPETFYRLPVFRLMQNVADNHFALPIRIPGMHHNPDIFMLYQNLQNLKLLPLSGLRNQSSRLCGPSSAETQTPPERKAAPPSSMSICFSEADSSRNLQYLSKPTDAQKPTIQCIPLLSEDLF